MKKTVHWIVFLLIITAAFVANYNARNAVDDGIDAVQGAQSKIDEANRALIESQAIIADLKAKAIERERAMDQAALCLENATATIISLQKENLAFRTNSAPNMPEIRCQSDLPTTLTVTISSRYEFLPSNNSDYYVTVPPGPDTITAPE